MTATNWLEESRDRSRERRTLVASIALACVLGLVVPLIDLPDILTKERPLPTLTRITLPPPEIVEPPPPPPIEEKPEPKEIREEVAEVEVEPPPVERPIEREPEEQQVAEVDTPRPAVEVPPEPSVDDQALASLSAFDDAFADMREPDTALEAASNLQQTSGEVASVERSLIAANHGAVDLGVNLAAQSRNVGNVALTGRETTRVAAPVEAASGKSSAEAEARALERVARAHERSLEEIRRVFDANKGILFALYQSARAAQPGLAGKVVLELVIAPDGAVVTCRVISSEIADAALVDRVVQRVRSFRFAADDVSTTTVTYPVHFLPT